MLKDLAPDLSKVAHRILVRNVTDRAWVSFGSDGRIGLDLSAAWDRQEIRIERYQSIIDRLSGYAQDHLNPDNFGDPVPGQTGRLFLPFDAMVGRVLKNGWVASLEGGVPIIKDYPVYDFKIEARVHFSY